MKEKNKELELNIEKTTPYKRKGRKLEFSEHEDESSSEKSSKHNTKKHQHSSESSDNSNNKNKYKPYEEIYREFKKIKPPMFNGEIQKGEEVKAWLSGMNKYFHNYKFSGELKAKLAICDLRGKTDIWW